MISYWKATHYVKINGYITNWMSSLWNDTCYALFGTLLEQVFMLECSKNTLFFTYLTLLQLLTISNTLISCLYEAPLSGKHNVIWLVGWTCIDWSSASKFLEISHLLP